jgi:hypothetical protein
VNLVRKSAVRTPEQLQIGLMDKGSRLQSVIWTFTGQVTGGDAVEFPV